MKIPYFNEDSSLPIYENDPLSFIAHSISSFQYQNEIYNPFLFNLLDFSSPDKNKEVLKNRL